MNAGARELLAWLRAARVYSDFERFFLPLLRDADAMARMKAYADKVASAAAEDAKLRAERERQQDNLERETLADDRARAVLQIQKEDDAAAAIASFRRMADTLSVERDAARLDELADALDYLAGSWRREHELRLLALPPQDRPRARQSFDVDAARPEHQRYESIVHRIQLQCRLKQLDRPAAAAVAQEAGYQLAPEEVRAGAPRCLRPSTLRETHQSSRAPGPSSASRAAQVNDAAKLRAIREDVLQRMYDAGLEARYAPLTQKIPLGVQLGWLGAALVAASLSKEGRLVTEADVRGGAARPFLPFAREDRSRRAHARPSSTTPRRAGPRPGRARAFLGR